uniref:F-box domain-containing protein n=1 Tax=Meloidogyne incognita TaxID=6306 RepID=A0A914MN14_MELIC
MFSLPTEVQLDIFKFLNYEELCSIKQTNLYFRDFVNDFEEELAREKFYEISIVYFDQCKQYPHKLIKPEAENVDFSLNDEQLEEKFKNGLSKPIPLYLPDLDSDKNLVIRLSKGKILLN